MPGFSATQAGWLHLMAFSSGTNLFGVPLQEVKGTFCSLKCLADWAYVADSVQRAGDQR